MTLGGQRTARLALGLLLAGAGSCARAASPEGVPLQEASSQELSAEDERTVWDGVYNEEQAERGRLLYAEECSGCHAPDLRGDNTSPSLVGQSFAFLFGGLTLGELFGKIQSQMPTDRPGSLSAQTYRDILAFVLSANGHPRGENELEADDLDHIVIAPNPDP